MKKYHSFLLLFAFILFSNGNCEDKERQSLFIQNNSDMEIIITYRNFKYTDNPGCVSIKTLGGREYKMFIYDRMIKPHSSKNMIYLAASMLYKPRDTTYICVFNREDLDTMSCDVFVEKYPLKKEWKVTVEDMEACNWTLVYTPEE